MRKPKDPRDLALKLLDRSPCSVQVAAVMVDNWGIHAWSWNNVGRDGFGEHAEAACIRRANASRMARSTLYIAARRKRNGRAVTARPCLRCQGLIKRCQEVIYRDGEGIWRNYA